MTWSVLQSAGANFFGTSVTATFGSNASSGSKIIAVVGSDWSDAPTSVKDAAGNSWTQLGSATSTTNGSIWLYGLDVPAGDVGIAVALTALFPSSNGQSIVVAEMSGLLAGNTSAMLDGTPVALTGTAATTGSPAYSSAVAGEFLACGYADKGGAVTTTAASGMTRASGSQANFSDASLEYGNSTGGSESTGFGGAYTVGWTILAVAFKLAGGASPAWPPAGARRPSSRVPALPPARRYRQPRPVPAQLSPPYGFTEITQRRQAWPRGVLRRGHVTVAVPPQLNPPYPFAELRQQRQPRGLFPRRGHGFAPVPGQQAAAPNPAITFQQARRPRALFPRRGRAFAPVPAQQSAPVNPAFTWQPQRHPRLLAPRRGHGTVHVPGQQDPAPRQRTASRRSAVPSRRGRVTQPPQQQAAAVAPAWVQQRRVPARILSPSRRGRLTWPPQAQAAAVAPAWVASHRGPLRALALIRRRFRQLMPWSQATQPAFTDGILTAATAPTSTLTAGTAASGTLTATTSTTGGPS